VLVACAVASASITFAIPLETADLQHDQIFSRPFLIFVSSRVIRERKNGSNEVHRRFVYESCTILSSFLKNFANSSEKNETNSVFPIKKLDLPKCAR
jgi:hypothetical protein